MDPLANQDPPKSPGSRDRSNVSLIVSAAVGLGVLVLLVIGLFVRDSSRPQVGDPAPGLSLTLLDGTVVSLDDVRGQVVVINFWASWCAPCREEAPDLQAVYEHFQDRDVVFLGVTYQDAEAASLEFVKEHGITYGNGFDAQGRIGRAYGVTAVPETFLVDREGNVAWTHIGAVEASVLSAQVERLIKE